MPLIQAHVGGTEGLCGDVMGLVHKPNPHQRGLTLIEHAPHHCDG